MVRKGILMVGLLASAACTKKVVETTISPAPDAATSAQLAVPLEPGQVGATTSRGAVESFLASVRTQDLRGMSAVWGNEKGPTAGRIGREELEKRLIVIQCMLGHEKWQFTEDRARLVTGGRQEHMVELQQKQATAVTKMTTVSNPAGRWFVEDIDLGPMKDFCR